MIDVRVVLPRLLRLHLRDSRHSVLSLPISRPPCTCHFTRFLMQEAVSRVSLLFAVGLFPMGHGRSVLALVGLVEAGVHAMVEWRCCPPFLWSQYLGIVVVWCLRFSRSVVELLRDALQAPLRS